MNQNGETVYERVMRRYDNWPDRAVIFADHLNNLWTDRPVWYWLWRLGLEFTEACLSFLGLHKDPLEYELLQVASIAINLLNKLEGVKHGKKNKG